MDKELTRQVTVTHYRFEALSDKAKQRVKDWLYSDGMHWERENWESFTTLVKRFNGQIRDWSIDSGYYSGWVRIDADDIEEDILADIVNELGSYDPTTLRGNGDCVLTGYCADEYAIDGLRKAYHAGERNVENLLWAGFATWRKACNEEYEYHMTDEAIAETCEANDYWFDENGGFVR